MPNDINGLDEQDLGLKGIFGDRFQDASADSGAERSKNKETTYTSVSQNTEQSGAHKRTHEDARWEPVKPNPNWLDKLKACSLWGIGFGSLNLLIFYWQQSGLMDASIAIPCMWACMALAGWGVGKTVGGKR